MQSYDDFRDRFDDNERVGLEVVFPLFDGGVMRQRSAQADARVRELDFEAAAYRMQRQAELSASWRRLDALDLSLLSIDDAIAAATDYVNAARRSFDLRAATLNELLDAEDALTDLEVRKIALEWERREVLIRQLQGRMSGLLIASD
jgi:outer membrane protein TolC